MLSRISKYIITVYQVIFPRIPPWNSVLNLRELILHEIIVRASIYLICKRLCQIYANEFFHDFGILVNKAENGCTRKKPDIRYMNMTVCVLSFILFSPYHIEYEWIFKNTKYWPNVALKTRKMLSFSYIHFLSNFSQICFNKT